jgi:hypothetical protein
VRYPNYRGDEPCTTVGPELYEASVKTESMLVVLRQACASCWILDDCQQWALHHEAMSTAFWGGLTADERKQLRRQSNIRPVDPLLMVEMHRASA